MAEFSSPIASGLRIRRSRVSSFTFLNRSQEQPREDFRTTLALQQNRLAFESINSSLINLSAQVSALSASLSTIGEQVRQTSAVEQAREAQKQRQEQILAEQQLREGKESVVERKMQNALIRPIQKVGQKAQFTLGRLANFFNILIGGFLGNLAIQTISALVTGDKEKLDQLKKKFLDNIGIVAGIFLALNGGFGFIFSILSRLTARLAGAAFRNLLIRPVQLLLDLVRNAAGNLLPGRNRRNPNRNRNRGNNTLPGGGGRNRPGSNTGGRTGPGGTRPRTRPQTQRPRVPRGRPGVGGFLNTLPFIFQGVNDLTSGESFNSTIGGLGGLASLLLLPPVLRLPAFIFGGGAASDLGRQVLTPTLSKLFPQLDRNAQGDLIDSLEDSALGQLDINGNRNNDLPQLRDEQGNVTIINGGSSQSGQGSIPAVSGDANYLPAVGSSNPDNFYVLYSQIQYNVVG